MTVKKSTRIRITLSVLAFSVLVVCVKYFPFAGNVPISLKPVDHRAAKNLARTIAKSAKCNGLEHEDYQEGKVLVSVCRKKYLVGAPYTEASFSIYVFFNKQAKSAFIEKYLASEIFKEGDYFIVNEDASHGDSPSNYARPKSRSVYADFPGK